MPNTQQSFLAAATEKAAADLAEAFMRLPEDKRLWQPAEGARSAMDQVAECALLNGYTIELMQTRLWSPGNYKFYEQNKAEAVSGGWDTLRALLLDSTHALAAAIAAVPDEALQDEIEVPGSPQTLLQIMARQHWNMTYHEGQINYILSLLL